MPPYDREHSSNTLASRQPAAYTAYSCMHAPQPHDMQEPAARRTVRPVPIRSATPAATWSPAHAMYSGPTTGRHASAPAQPTWLKHVDWGSLIPETLNMPRPRHVQRPHDRQACQRACASPIAEICLAHGVLLSHVITLGHSISPLIWPEWRVIHCI